MSQRTFWYGIPTESVQLPDFVIRPPSACVLEESSGHAGLNQAGTYGVDADIRPGQLIGTGICDGVYTSKHL